MRIGAALSTDLDPAKATTEAVEEARFRLGETEVSLAVLVTSNDPLPLPRSRRGPFGSRSGPNGSSAVSQKR